MAKPKYSRFVSPIGTFDLCFVVNASKKYNSDETEFKTNVVIEDTEENRAWCEKVFDTGMAEGKAYKVKLKKGAQSPFHYPEDADEDDFVPEDGKDRPKYDPELYRGRIWFAAKSKFKPGLIDTARQSLDDDVKVFGGDKGRVKIEVNPYEGFGSGISLRLVTVQLVDKSTSFSPGGVDADGFDDVDGYVSNPQVDDEEEF